MALTDYEIATKAHAQMLDWMQRPLNDYRDVWGDTPTTRTSILTDIVLRLVEEQDQAQEGADAYDLIDWTEEMMPKWQERESFVLTIYRDRFGYHEIED